MPQQYSTKDIARFYSKVSKIPTEQGCLEWTAYHERSGYGAFKVGKKNAGAHRVAWELVNGPIPAGLVIRHMCHNPRCVNPAHLQTGTYADNVADMMRSGRYMNAPNTTTPYVRPPIAKRFYARVSETPTESGCLEWLGGIDRNGYGFLSVGNKIAFAHRVAWELVNGPIPAGLVIAHHCDNPRCCRVEHLWLCTQIDNIHDMNAKGRNSPPPMHLGEGNHKAKLTAGQVMEIRSGKFAGWGQHRIAQHFGISQVQVGNILNRTSWAHLDPTQDVPHENLVARGEQSGKAKLTERDVIAIRSDLYMEWTLDAIGQHFGISGEQVSSILRRKSWTHLDAPCESDPIKGKRDLRKKLTAEQVLEIRSDLYGEWTRVDIARHFGINEGQVGKILNRKQWAHLDATRDAPYEGGVAKGEQISSAKLTAQDVLAIRSDLYIGWTRRAIGEHFGISDVQVGNILRRKVWKHI